MSSTSESYKEKGNEEFRKGNYEKAIEYYTYAVEMYPNDHRYYTNRSLCYSAMGKWDKSLRDAEKSVKLKPDWDKGHYRRGMALMNLGRYQDAVEAFETLHKIKPNVPDYQAKLAEAKRMMFSGMSEAEILKTEGNEAFKQGKIEEAIQKFQRALDAAGNDEKMASVKADIYANRAACYQQLYEPLKIIADCDEALRLNPGHIKALLRRAQAKEGLEKYKQALEDFELALRMAPDNQPALNGANRCRSAVKKLGM